MITVFQNGNDLYAMLASNNPYSAGQAVGYIAGGADVGASNVISGFRFCLPQGATEGQLASVVKNWLEKYPERRHFAARGLVAASLFEAFPCAQAAQ